MYLSPKKSTLRPKNLNGWNLNSIKVSHVVCSVRWLCRVDGHFLHILPWVNTHGEHRAILHCVVTSPWCSPLSWRQWLCLHVFNEICLLISSHCSKTLRYKNEILYFLKRYKVSLLSSTRVDVYTRWGALDKVLLIQEVKFSANLIKKNTLQCVFLGLCCTPGLCVRCSVLFLRGRPHNSTTHRNTHGEMSQINSNYLN